MKISDLMEARRNADHPSQEKTRMSKVGAHSPNYYLEKYKDDPSIYVSFSPIPKLGINPISNWSTPQGIYFYPLSSMYSPYRSFSDTVPYAGDRPYMFIVRSKVKLTNVKDYSSNDLNKDKENIVNVFGKDVFNKIMKIVDKSEMNLTKPISLLWLMGGIYSRYIDNDSNTSMTHKYTSFFKKLGYNGFDDRDGYGTISVGEPKQSVFFSTKDFEILEMITFHKKIDNDNNEKKTSKIPDFSKMETSEREQFFISHPKLAVQYANKDEAYAVMITVDPHKNKDVFFALASKFPKIIPSVIEVEEYIPNFVLIAASKKDKEVMKEFLSNPYIDSDFVRWALKNYPDYIKYVSDDNRLKSVYIEANKNENK